MSISVFLLALLVGVESITSVAMHVARAIDAAHARRASGSALRVSSLFVHDRPIIRTSLVTQPTGIVLRQVTADLPMSDFRLGFQLQHMAGWKSSPAIPASACALSTASNSTRVCTPSNTRWHLHYPPLHRLHEAHDCAVLLTTAESLKIKGSLNDPRQHAAAGIFHPLTPNHILRAFSAFAAASVRSSPMRPCSASAAPRAATASPELGSGRSRPAMASPAPSSAALMLPRSSSPAPWNTAVRTMSGESGGRGRWGGHVLENTRSDGWFSGEGCGGERWTYSSSRP